MDPMIDAKQAGAADSSTAIEDMRVYLIHCQWEALIVMTRVHEAHLVP